MMGNTGGRRREVKDRIQFAKGKDLSKGIRGLEFKGNNVPIFFKSVKDGVLLRDFHVLTTKLSTMQHSLYVN